MILRRKKVDSDIEEKILTGLIISDVLCRDMEAILQSQKEAFESPYIQKISRMIMAYYKKYRKAPGRTIQDIFNTEKKRMKEDERDLISAFLSRISDEYDDKTFNVDYLKDKAQNYFKKRSLKEISEVINSLVEIDKISEAEKEIAKYKKISKLTSEWIDPFDLKEVKKVFDDERSGKDVLFRMPGRLGELMGDFERNQLIAVLAPVKKGKTFMLSEIGIEGVLEKWKVVIISLEMASSRIQKRLYKRITSQGKEGRDYIFPCFDCLKNQENTCNKIQRGNSIRLLDVDGNKPEVFDPALRYRPCTYCRDKNKSYIPETWFITYKKDRITTKFTQKISGSIKRMYGDNLRIISFPAYSANVSDIKSAIDNLEYQEGFIPDVVCIAEGSLVLTDSGLVPIEKVSATHKLWDGENWVSHGGVIYNGIKEVIEYNGLTATPDHLVWTEEGWRTLESCKRLGLRIAQTGNCGGNLRIGENYFFDSTSSEYSIKKKRVCLYEVYQMWKRKVDTIRQFIQRSCKGMQNMFAAKKIPYLALSKNGKQTANMSKSQNFILEVLWWSWNKILLFFNNRILFMDCKKFKSFEERIRNRQDRQQWPLRTREYSMVYSQAKYFTYNKNTNNSQIASDKTDLSANTLFGRDIKNIFKNKNNQSNSFSLGEQKIRREKVVRGSKKPVWDIANAGPFHRFTVQGFLVHNCIDYADILAPEDARMTPRERSDDTWKTLKNLADSRHCLVVTASQSNRISFDKKNVTQTDIAEDIRKVAHVDMMISLNQSPSEKVKGVMRIAVIAGRDIDFDQYKTATILQQLELGQVVLDSEIIRYAKTKKEVKKEEGKEPTKEKPMKQRGIDLE